MTIVRNIKLLPLLLAMMLGFACKTKTDEKSKLIAKKWSYMEFKMNDEVMTGEQLEYPVMEFLDDGKYKIEFGPMSEEGKWQVEGNELVTTTNENKTTRLKIMEITEEKLILHSEVDGSSVYITLAPATAGK